MNQDKNQRKDGTRSLYDFIEKDSKIQSTKQLEEFYYENEIITPYENEKLLDLVEESDILKPLINTMATNTALMGYRISYKEDFDYNSASYEEKKKAKEEYQKLNNLFKYFNPIENFNNILYKAVIDKETLGYGCIEILRNGKGEISGGEYARSCNFRIVVQDPKDRISYMNQRRISKDGQVETVKIPRKFKKFVQIVSGQKIYFKEFGDQRPMNAKTGKYENTKPQATEIAFINIHSPFSEYGIPRYTGNIPNILGNRKSEELNLKFFTKGKMTPFAILVNGGMLTKESINALQEGKGIGNMFNALLLEATNSNDKEDVDIKIEKLSDTSLKDGLFIDYQNSNRDKIRSSFAIPSIYLGDGDKEKNLNTQVARIIAEEQIFAPDRKQIEDVFNLVLTNEMDLRYCKMSLKGQEIKDITQLSKTLEPFIKAGAVTPNMLIDILGKILNKDLKPYDNEFGDIPIEILKLNKEK